MRIQVGIISHQPMENELLERCLQSLVRLDAGIEYQLLLQFSKGSHAENINRLIDKADCDFLCILEDDTAALKPFWLRSMVRTMIENRNTAIVMPIETKDGLQPDPGFRQWMDKTAAVQATYGFCNLIRMEVGLRADEKLTYFVDIDLSRQALHKGWLCMCNGHVWLLHGSPNGRMSTDPDIDQKQAKDHAYLDKKWESLQGEQTA